MKYFTYKIGHYGYKVRTRNIVYLESYKRKVTLHLANGLEYEFYGKLRDIYKESLLGCGFIHIHRSYLVNFKYIAKFKRLELTLTDGTTLPVSKLRYDEIKAQYLNYLDARSNSEDNYASGVVV